MTRSGWFFALSLAAAAGCSSSGGGQGADCQGDRCDQAAEAPLRVCDAAADFETAAGELSCTPCGDVLADRSGRGFVPGFVADDPLVRKVYMTFVDANANNRIDPDEIDCPVAMPAIMQKLRNTDLDGGQSCNHVTTHVVSETAALLGEDKASYRTVTSRECDDRPLFHLLFSSFGFRGDPAAVGTGVHTTEEGHPGQVEVIAFDKTEGVFNFYKEVGGKMQFFGTSIDFIAAGPGGPGLTSTRGCANCHPGGGLNMKELRLPWTHWAGDDDVVGADVLVQSRRYLNLLASGQDLQQGIIEPGNQVWGTFKAKFFETVTTDELAAIRSRLRDDPMTAAQSADLAQRQLGRDLTATQAMLEPLFCSVQVNINASNKFNMPPQIFVSGRNQLRFDGFIDMGDALFDTALAKLDSRVPGAPGKTELTNAFMVVEPSQEDETYANSLAAHKVIDQQLIEDVMMVDFTRPVFSDDRCGLLALVPDLPPEKRKLPELRDAIIDSLEQAGAAAGTPAGQLLAHLEASKSGKPLAHAQTRQRYVVACSARPAPDVVRDGLKLRSLQRKLGFARDGALDDAAGPGAHPYAVFEFENTMPVDGIVVTASAIPDAVTEVHPGARWSPNDCTLVSSYLAPAAP